MIIITVDRFLEFQLTIKYTLFCTVKLTKIVVSFFIFLTTAVFSLVLVLFVKSPWNYQNFLWIYVYVPGNIVFVVIASLIYFFIFKKLRTNIRDFERRRREVNVCVQKKSTFKLFVQVSLLWLSFYLPWCQTWYLCFRLRRICQDFFSISGWSCTRLVGFQTLLCIYLAWKS